MQNTGRQVLRDLLRNFSAEVLAKDEKGIQAARAMPPGSEVFVANLPNESLDQLVRGCAQVQQLGMVPVPHIVARNIRDAAELDRTLAQLVQDAGVHTALVLAGDRDQPVGDFASSLQVLSTGLFRKHGVERVALACHPEGHPRVSGAVLWPALFEKIEGARSEGLNPYLVSQFAFGAEPIVAFTRKLRAAGETAPLRVGVAGPAKRATLIKFALLCGVGASLKALKERQELSRNMLAGEAPEALLNALAQAQAAEPGLGFDSVHFFTFGSIPRSVDFAEALRA